MTFYIYKINGKDGTSAKIAVPSRSYTVRTTLEKAYILEINTNELTKLQDENNNIRKTLAKLYSMEQNTNE